MYNFAEFKKKPDCLSDILLWAALVAPGVVLNKDGSLQKTFRFRGPDLDSSTEPELVATIARLNNSLKRLTGSWAVYAEAQRMRSRRYPVSEFPDAITFMIDEERRRYFERGDHYESAFYVTFVYLPPEEAQNKIKEMLIEGGTTGTSDTFAAQVEAFRKETINIAMQFGDVLPVVEELNDDETLTYLHSTISPKQQQVRRPEIPMFLDAILADSPLVGGLEPRLGDHYLRIVTIRSFPGSSTPGVLDALNRCAFSYRWVSRFIPLDKADAESELKKYKKNWFAKRQGALQMLMSSITGSQSQMVDNDALNKSADADEALQELGGDYVSYGYFTASVVVWDRDPAAVIKKAETVQRVINNLGFTTINETLNAVDAWLGSLPGHCHANIRRPLMSTLNLAHLLPVSAVWAGPDRNKHLAGPPLMQVETKGSTPFRLNLHVGDVGHALVIGPTGAGKSVLLCTLEAQFRRYPKAQIYIFDKGGSSRILTTGVGGDFYDLGSEEPGALSFQPLAGIHDENERNWAQEYVLDLLRNEKVEITPETKKHVFTALNSLATGPVEQRTMSGLTFVMQDQNLKQALEPYTIKGAFGKLLDSDRDGLGYGNWQAFEMGLLMNTPSAVPPVLSYLFHALEKRFTGAPTILILDEAWVYLDNPLFAAKIKEWLKVLRKLNVSVIFATQSIADVANSAISSALIESCPTQILLPNPKALDEQQSQIYRRFGCNEKEIAIIGHATPKKHYYYRSPFGNRLFSLGLEAVALAYVAASAAEDQTAAKAILAEHGPNGFNEAWLHLRDLSWAAEYYANLMRGS